MPNLRQLGAEAEDRAATYLLGLGYTLVTRRFKAAHGEIDLVALDGENAWEHYPQNGYHFLKGLYAALAEHLNQVDAACNVDIDVVQSTNGATADGAVYVKNDPNLGWYSRDESRADLVSCLEADDYEVTDVPGSSSDWLDVWCASQTKVRAALEGMIATGTD